MWKIKYGKSEEEDPNLFSTNNFLGRQTFEFDPNAGTPEERAEIEEARQNIWVAEDGITMQAFKSLISLLH